MPLDYLSFLSCDRVPAPPVSSPASPQAPPQAVMTVDDVRTLIEVWKSINVQMEDMLGLTGQGKSFVQNWPERLKKDSALTQEQLSRMRDAVDQSRVSIATLKNSYGKFPNVGSALEEVDRDGVFQRLYRSFDSFAREVQLTRSSPPAPNTEIKLRPYATGLDGALEAMTKWANTTRDFAKLQSDELSGQK
jgi:hypothetical protein